MAQDTLKHPTLHRTLRGTPSPTTLQFRNLKYATIPGRWQDSFLTDTLSQDAEEIFDATTFGPACPQNRRAQAWDTTLVGNMTLPARHDSKDQEPMDEFNCLHLNVTVPKSALEQLNTGKPKKRLPVFVWVHGGGLSMGSNAWPQYDISAFVEHSISTGKPIIGVAINYRVNILGFLASKELGSAGNFGFKDQVLAFRWVKKHIAGFGGDASNVTAVGESAGGISLSTLLCADVGGEGLFERVVVMSGEATLRKPRGGAWHEEMYWDQLRLLKLDGLSTEQRTRKLRESSADELVGKLPLAQHFCAHVDGAFLKGNITLGIMSDGRKALHKPAWCKEFVTGDTAHDATCIKARIIDPPTSFSHLKSTLAKHLTPSESTALLSAYNLPSTTPKQQYFHLLTLASELRFHLPALAIHAGWKKASPSRPTHRYHFHFPNPAPGQFTGLASHELDVALLFGNFDDCLGEQGRRVGRQMRDLWIGFVNGEGWCSEGKVVVVGKEGLESVGAEEYDAKFRNGRGKVLERIGVDRLWKVAEVWQGVRGDEVDGGARAKI